MPPTRKKHALEEYRTVTSKAGHKQYIAVCRCGETTSPAPRRVDARMLYNEHRRVPVIDDPAQGVWKAEKPDTPDRLREGYERVMEPLRKAGEREEYDSLRKQIEKTLLRKRQTDSLDD